MIALTVVAACAVVQSLFGIGLLVFGTPTLLLLGYSFPETLAILLPASIAVSLLQVRAEPRPPFRFAMRFVCWCLIPLGITLAVVLVLDFRASLTLAVACALALFAVLRLSPALGGVVTRWVSRHESLWMMLMGIVHGLSNLGGGLLVILAASRYRDKERFRALVAFCYVCFAAVQLAVLAAVLPNVFDVRQVGSVVVAAIAFLAVGQPAFRAVPASAFDRLLTLLVAAYAGLLGLRFAGLL